MSHARSITLLLLAILFVAALLPQGVSLRFIAAPLLAISPAMDIMEVVAQLHSRGHEVLVLVTPGALDFVKSAAARHSSNTTAEGLRYLLVDVHYREFAKPKTLKPGEVPKPSMFSIPDRWPASLTFKLTAGVTMLQLFGAGNSLMAAQLLGNATLMQQLHDFQADAWMSVGLPIGSVMRDNTACIMSHALDTQMIDVSGNTFFEGPPSAAQFGTQLTPLDLQTLSGKALNLATWATYQLASFAMDFKTLPLDKLRQQYKLPLAASPCLLTEGFRKLRGLQTRRCKPLVEVMMSTWLVEYPRTLPPNVVLVGPGTARPAHPISPPEVAAFVNSAPQGVVLAAFGTVYGPTLRPEDVLELAKGFAVLELVRVLWALKPASVPPGVDLSMMPTGKNTLVVPWVDYNDVLGHPNIKAFVSHCGMHSVNEAAYHGVPLVALPFQFEQAENAMKLESRGAAVVCRQSPAFRRGSAAAVAMMYAADDVATMIKQVIANGSISESAQAIGNALQSYAAHRHPYERAADEIELAVLAAHAPEANAAAAGQPVEGDAGIGGLSRDSTSTGLAVAVDAVEAAQQEEL